MSSNELADRSAPSGLCEVRGDVKVIFDVGPRKLTADSAAWMGGGAFKVRRIQTTSEETYRITQFVKPRALAASAQTVSVQAFMCGSFGIEVFH